MPRGPAKLFSAYPHCIRAVEISEGDRGLFIPFFLELKAARVPVTLREYLTLLEAMDAGLVQYDVEGFYYLARSALVKDERHIDRFDQVFAHVFRGVEALSGEAAIDVSNLPDDCLRRLAEKHLTEEEKRLVEALGAARQSPPAVRAHRDIRPHP